MVDILRRVFNLHTSVQVVVVNIFVLIDGLITESNFEYAAMVAAENKSSATVRLNLAVSLERMPTRHSQSVY